MLTKMDTFLRMTKSTIAVVVVASAMGTAGAVVGCASTPSPESRSAERTFAAADYYPLQPGWKWAYDLEREGQHMLAVYSVLERTPDTAIVQAGDERLSYAVTAAGIAQKEGAELGDFVLKNPLALGAAWHVMGGNAKIAAVGQTVTAPSGVYNDCVVVEVLRSDPTRLSRTTFAPGVGPVEIELRVQDGGRFITTMRASLRGVTKPGEDPLAAN